MSMRRFYRATAETGKIEEEVEPSVAFQLEELFLHLNDDGGAGDLTVTKVSGAADDVYDTVLLTEDMTNVQDLHWQPDRPINCAKDDKIKVEWDNANGRTYGLEIVWSAVAGG